MLFLWGGRWYCNQDCLDAESEALEEAEKDG